MIAALIAAGIIAVVLAIARPLMFASIDPAVAAARGVPVRALGLLLLVLLGATTAEATQAIGALLLLGLLAAPAGAAQRLTANPYHALGLSAAIAVLSTWAGLTLSYELPKLPPSSAIIAVATGDLPARVSGHHRPAARHEARAAERDPRDRELDSRLMARKDTENWAGHAQHVLAQTNHHTGAARRALLELLDTQTCALSAIEIEDALRKRKRPIGRASIYRILDELEHLHLVQKIQVGQAMARYEPIRSGDGHHHHLVCDNCGTVTPFTDPELETAIKKLERRVPMRVAEHEIVLHGACQDCSD